MGATSKKKRSDTTPVTPHTSPKCRSMRIRQARFTGAHTWNSGASGAGEIHWCSRKELMTTVMAMMPLRLRLVFHGMDTMQLLDITDHRLLCWRDAVCEAMTLGFRVDFLMNLM
ncbi:hypothetical protein Pyn_23291 [Prunus yedoensis var. nudiflora]|uniref:Uncharacterized protein n=1 Tax=Prunus yedoensis var. nudiflora TaxID=2094558 RepID=A0A314UZ55_PRUYE|nr:hypothetical protein Pyn_23291 [Prunus yedoensis var. nudiflora]